MGANDSHNAKGDNVLPTVPYAVTWQECVMGLRLVDWFPNHAVYTWLWNESNHDCWRSGCFCCCCGVGKGFVMSHLRADCVCSGCGVLNLVWISFCFSICFLRRWRLVYRWMTSTALRTLWYLVLRNQPRSTETTTKITTTTTTTRSWIGVDKMHTYCWRWQLGNYVLDYMDKAPSIINRLNDKL